MPHEPKFRILLPLRPSEPVLDAANLLGNLFPPEQTLVRRFYVHRPIELNYYVPESYFALPEIAQLNLEAETASRTEAESGLEPLRSAGFHLESEVVEGIPATEILREAHLWRADLIVMRRREIDSVGARIGTLTSAMLHHAPTPVLTYGTVPAKWRPSRVAIASDLSPAAHEGAEWGLALASVAHAEAELVYVAVGRAEEAGTGHAVLARAAATEAEEWLARARALLIHANVDAHVKYAADVAEGVLVFAREHACDLVAISSIGRSAAWSILLGSNARSIVRNAECPVLVVPSTNRVRAEQLLAKLKAAEAELQLSTT